MTEAPPLERLNLARAACLQIGGGMCAANEPLGVLTRAVFALCVVAGGELAASPSRTYIPAMSRLETGAFVRRECRLAVAELLRTLGAPRKDASDRREFAARSLRADVLQTALTLAEETSFEVV